MVHTILDLIRSKALQITCHYYDAKNKRTKRQMKPDDINIHGIATILSSYGVKVFHNVEDKDTEFKEEIYNIHQVFQIYGNEVETYTTYKAIAVGPIPNIVGFSVRINSPNVTLRLHHMYGDTVVKQKDNKEIYFIPQMTCSEDIQQRVQQKKFNLAQYQQVKLDLFASLKILFENGYVHRDIKPENIVYCSAEKIQYKLIDFGFLHQAGDPRFFNEYAGTGYYISPRLVNYYTHERRILTADEIQEIIESQKKLVPLSRDFYQSIHTFFQDTAFMQLPLLTQMDYENDLYAVYITLKGLRMALFTQKQWENLYYRQNVDTEIMEDLRSFMKTLRLPVFLQGGTPRKKVVSKTNVRTKATPKSKINK